MLKDYRVEIIDTAGLHTAQDAIEQQGIEKTLELAQNADFYLVIVDHSQPSLVCPILSSLYLEKNTLVIENKIDLKSEHSQKDFLSDCPHCPISLKTNTGIDALKSAMHDLIDQGIALPKGNDAIVLNARHTWL